MPRARFIDLHALQSVTPACLNRGEDDEPKTIHLGGARRAMVSSQCWKRPIRLEMEDELDEHAARTRLLPARVTAALRAAGWPEELAAFAGTQVARCATRAGLATDPDHGLRTQAMLFVREDIVAALVDLCERYRTDLEKAAADQHTPTTGKRRTAPQPVLPTRDVATQITRRTATISLFGRMLAELPEAHVEGVVQVAPAYTVHESDPQPDFFTAVEEWSASGDHGSAHLQTAYLTTGVFYRYATVNVTELLSNIEQDTAQARYLLGLLIESFITALPQAKRTSTAAHTLPYLVHYAVRDRRPISFGPAFEQPIRPAPRGGYTQPARQALSDYAAAINRLTGSRRRLAHGHAGTHTQPLDHLGEPHPSYQDLIDACVITALAPARTCPQEASA